MAAYFPRPLCPHKNGREPFAGYGTMGNVAFSVDDNGRPSFIPQHDQHHSSTLAALTPSLPLLPPSDFHSPLHDPCMQALNEHHAAMQQKLKYLFAMKSKLSKGQSSYKQSMSKFVAKMSNLALCKDLCEEEVQLDIHLGIAQLPPWFRNLAEKVSDDIGKPTHRPKVNAQYSGGGLDVVTGEDDTGYLCFASGSEMNNISVAKVLKHDTHGVQLESKADLNQVSSGGVVYQIQTERVQGDALGIARQSDRTCLFEVVDENECLELRVLDDKPWEAPVSAVALNRYVPGEYAVCCDNTVSVISPDTKPCQVIGGLEPRFSCPEVWRSVHWGGHARELVVTDRTAMDVYDIRIPDARKPAVALFELPHSILTTKERIMASTSHPGLFHHLLVTDYSMVLVDRRFPNHPVLNWSHTMLEPPAYIYTIQSNSGVDSILLASHLQPETHCFQMTLGDAGGQSSRSSVPVKPPQSLGPPWRVSSPRDFAAFSRRQGVELDAGVFKHKLDLPITGVCGFQRGEDLTVFQMTSHGDIFQQSYTQKTHKRQDVTFNSGAGSQNIVLDQDIVEYGRKWLQAAQDFLYSATLIASDVNVKTIDASDAASGVNRRSKFAHILCSACMPQNASSVEYDPAEDETECMACELKLKVSMDIKQAILADKCMPSIDPEALNLDVMTEEEIQEFAGDDFHSSLYYKLWTGDTEISEEIQKRDEEICKKRMEKKRQKMLKKGIDIGDSVAMEDIKEDDDVDEDNDEEDKISGNSEESIPMDNTGNNSPDNNSNASDNQKQVSEPKEKSFLSEQDIANSLAMKKQSQSSGASVSSFASKATDFSLSPGFSLTPIQLRMPITPIRSEFTSSPKQSNSQQSKDMDFPFLTPSLTPKRSQSSLFGPGSPAAQTSSQGKKKRKSVMGF